MLGFERKLIEKRGNKPSKDEISTFTNILRVLDK
jgi:hypothetical protein